MSFFAQHHVIVAHAQINNCGKLKPSYTIQGVQNIWHMQRVPYYYFVQLSEVSDESYCTIFLGYNESWISLF